MDNAEGFEPIIVSSSSLGSAKLSVVRGRMWDHIDFRLFGIVLLSICLHAALLGYLRSVPIPKKQIVTIDQIPERYAKFIMDKPIPKQQSAKRARTEGEGANAGGAKKEAEKKPEATGTGGEPGKVSEERMVKARQAAAVRAKQVEQKIRSAGVFGVLAGIGGTARGPAVVDVLGRAGRVGAATGLDDQLKGITGLTGAATALNQTLVRSREGVGSAQKTDISDLIMGLETAKSNTLTHRAEIQWYKPPEIIGQASSSSKRAQDAINRVVKVNLATVKVTYERILKLNPNLSGKLTVRFTIEEDGSVSNVEIVESTVNSPELEREIERKVARWTFDPLAAGSGTTVVTYPFIFQPE